MSIENQLGAIVGKIRELRQCEVELGIMLVELQAKLDACENDLLNIRRQMAQPGSAGHVK